MCELPQLLALDTVQGIGGAAKISKESIESGRVSKSASASSSLAKLKEPNKATSKAEELPSKNPLDIPDYALKPVPEKKRFSRTLRWVAPVVTYALGAIATPSYL